MIQTITMRRSNNGVPHMLVVFEDITFSVCYFGKQNLYRIFLYGYGPDNRHLEDIPVGLGGAFNLEFVLRGIKEKHGL